MTKEVSRLMHYHLDKTLQQSRQEAKYSINNDKNENVTFCHFSEVKSRKLIRSPLDKVKL